MEAKNQEQKIVKYENISEQVLKRITQYQNAGTMTLPDNYSVENHLKAAWLELQEVTDRNGKSALQVCSQTSVANSLLDMILQGLAVSKKQGYFIVYGSKLTFTRSYFGTVAVAKRAGGIQTEPVANVVYENDIFEYIIDTKTGYISIVKHEQKIDNINIGKIKAAYAIVRLKNGDTQVTIMTLEQIKKAWEQGSMKGKSGAHTNFTDEMAKRTVINRACKLIINSSDDAWLYDGKSDSFDENSDENIKKEELKEDANKDVFAVENVDFEEVKTSEKDEKKAAQQESQPESKQSQQELNLSEAAPY
ncbi:MAG: recombinase RecT [Candidatus Paceibacterota bacterium]|jgi:recombination protein RecT